VACRSTHELFYKSILELRKKQPGRFTFRDLLQFKIQFNLPKTLFLVSTRIHSTCSQLKSKDEYSQRLQYFIYFQPLIITCSHTRNSGMGTSRCARVCELVYMSIRLGRLDMCTHWPVCKCMSRCTSCTFSTSCSYAAGASASRDCSTAASASVDLQERPNAAPHLHD
jgi:hypothetical protein